MDTQILAALQAVQQEPDGANDLFAFYERLIGHLSSKKSTLAAGGLLQSQAVSLSPQAPLLTWEALTIQADTFFPWLLSVTTLFDDRDPGTLDEVEALVEPENVLFLAQQWFEEGSANFGPTVDAVLANALAPYLEEAAKQLNTHHSHADWEEKHCPICGGLPDFTLWNERRGSHKLLCERCRTTWTVDHEGCVFCNEDDPNYYGFYNTEDDLYRVIVCDHCGHYLKAINYRQAKRVKLRPLLPVERLLTPGLDLLAIQEGYSRP